MGFCCSSAALYAALAAGLYFLYKYIMANLLQRKLDRWSHTPKDTVILHAFPKALALPNGSPFVLKLQTYLRMANIKHKVDEEDYIGPKGKCPWITLNGQHVSDSELAVEFLNKKFEKKLDAKHSDEKLALATSVRVMLEEHAFWGLALDRFVYTQNLGRITKLNFIVKVWVELIIKRNIKKQTYFHGIGRHTQQEIVNLVSKDLRTVSKLLGNKKFILADEPCVDDCAIFGILAQCVWGLPGSPYEKLVNDELTNLKQYCIRMKEKFFPDWEQCLMK